MDFGDIDLIFEPIMEVIDHSYLNEIEGLENPSSENLYGKDSRLNCQYLKK